MVKVGDTYMTSFTVVSTQNGQIARVRHKETGEVIDLLSSRGSSFGGRTRVKGHSRKGKGRRVKVKGYSRRK